MGMPRDLPKSYTIVDEIYQTSTLCNIALHQGSVDEASYLIAPICDTSELDMAHAPSRNYCTSRYDESDERAAAEGQSKTQEVLNVKSRTSRVSIHVYTALFYESAPHHDAAARECRHRIVEQRRHGTLQETWRRIEAIE